MGVDGFSISALGLPKDITSAQAAASAEQIILNSGQKTVDKVNNLHNKVVNNDEQKEHQKNQYFEDGYEPDEDEDSEEDLDEQKDEKALLKSVNKYRNALLKDPENVTIRVNNKNDKIELYNKATKKILESIKAEDFLEMINKLDYNSGILANFKI